MHLTSLTLRGFKSFADKTRLDFEPGITVVVGPNGSGKSNVVDALTWVLGSHSAKALRGGQMSDVIFAGSPQRRGLGRAAVEITIDNASGTLPIDFSEVTVSRSMFASGENEYAVNGESCRALDVAELLSDTGLGRDAHSIVNQGQLEAVLNCKPEERRSFIEEAAGILKHRRRKERSLRKLAQLDGHLERLQDVVKELRRQLKPLERQAEAARTHARLSAELAEVRRVRAARELDHLDRRLADERSTGEASTERVAEVSAEVDAERAREREIEQALEALAPEAEEVQRTHFRLSTLVERLRGLRERIEERRTGLTEAVEEPVAGRDPAQLRAEAAEARERLGELANEMTGCRDALERTESQRAEAERARRAHEQAAVAEARRRAEARERRIRWEGELSALRSSLAQATSEEGRLQSQVSGLEARREQLTRDVEAVQAEIQRLDAESGDVAARLEEAEQTAQRKEQAASEAAKAERDLERRRASLDARADALRAAGQEATGGAAALLEAVDAGELAGIRGPLAEEIRVADGCATALAAALGPLGDALVVESHTAAREAVAYVRANECGRVLLLAADPADSDTPDDADDTADAADDTADAADAEGDEASAGEADAMARAGARRLVEAVEAEPHVRAALDRALGACWLVADHDTAARLAAAHPRHAFVTPAGELAGPRGYAGGSAGPSSAVLSRAAAEQAEAERDAVDDELLRARRRVGDAERELQTARHELDAATAAMQESDAGITSAAERLGRLRKELAACEEELVTRRQQADDLGAEIAQQRERLATLEARGGDEPEGPDDEEDEDTPDLEAERLDDELAKARDAEVQARLRASTAEQRHDEVARQVEALEREADEVEAQLVERERRRDERLAAIQRCAELLAVAEASYTRTEASLQEAATARDEVEERRAARQRELGVVRARVRDAEGRLSELRDTQHAEQLARQQLEHELTAVRTRMAEELDLDPDAALAAARDGATRLEPAGSQSAGDVSGAGPVRATDEDADGEASGEAAGSAGSGERSGDDDPEHTSGDDDPERTPGDDGEPVADEPGRPPVLEGGEARDAELADEEKELEQRLALLGAVNPLALQEYQQLSDRYAFITEQIEDVRGSRRDLEKVISAVDERIRSVFAEAFADVDAAFQELFPRLFPGGEGNLELTDPDDLLESGVDVVARPPGKRVKRLSLLSGGERSLTAIAILFAIFRARPSPFYVLDEVEAALDDVNLQRFLEVVGDFRETSQLIIVTHQKRTMEAADLLYGVTMDGNGVSQVISQRMDEQVAAG
ncbi:AAA family ATPase [Egibacter rhizosphaerae]|uniref:AAA family ATPase n=1 Tax=Egibacter rhizosphaerae TaxID=1670831 RepID=UPI0013F17A82|nr:AAA family ATPase [Egibacter rhizosphaerae]